jgi:hypothetical protein
MENDSSANDPRKIWQDQPKEPSAMTLEKIRQKVSELHAKTRRKMLGSLAGPLCVGLFSAYGINLAYRLAPVLAPVFVFAIVWSLVGTYFLNRGMWPAAMPGDAALSTGIEYYRREVERQRAIYGRTLLWSVGPILLAIAMFILFLMIVGHGRIFPKALPFLLLILVWIGSYFVIRTRERRELQREIDDLKDIESQL